ncbi:hypothetical protein EBS02_11565, partial [bacterium]|nr:hypothetical protein [bacterium]
AIDLIDEAASSLKIEVESKPAELDEIDRKILQLKIEQEALKKEDDVLLNSFIILLYGILTCLLYLFTLW